MNDTCFALQSIGKLYRENINRKRHLKFMLQKQICLKMHIPVLKFVILVWSMFLVKTMIWTVWFLYEQTLNLG